ncbi:MAG: class II aldolase/adducin family protein [Treponema sp.]|jgi:rhamnose utilization protein RhaD (predicted bifunctional aldolase and dehydrogenase)|nr:class II aldolase/adducin family protein [Treponema sp.]
MTTTYRKLAVLSSIVGANPLLVQGGGGNTSVKDGQKLWVKASGTWLAGAGEQDIFLPVDIPTVLERTRLGIEDLSDLGRNGMRPSIETPFHAMMPQRVVLHLHMLDAIIYSSMPDENSVLRDKLHGLNWAMVPYARPDLPLSRIIDSVLEKAETAPELLVLQNHGIVIAAENEEDSIPLINDVMKRLRLEPRLLPVPDVFALAVGNDLSWRIPSCPVVHAPAFGPSAQVISGGLPLYPDHVVFLGPAALILNAGDTLGPAKDSFQKTYGFEPLFAIIRDCGVLVSPKMTPGAFAMLEALGNVCLRSPAGVELSGLSGEDVNALGNWDAEAYRKTLDSSEKK